MSYDRDEAYEHNEQVERLKDVRDEQIGDGTGNEILVAGALFALLSGAPVGGFSDVRIPEDNWNVIEFRLDFMNSRYRITVTQVSDTF